MNIRKTKAVGMGIMLTLLLTHPVSGADENTDSEEWTIEISPAMKLPLDDDVSISSGKDAQGNERKINVADYQRIYRAIPFRRAEYKGNPTYRHDSAMEILTGNPRTSTVVRHDNLVRRTPDRPYAMVPYRYNNRRWGLNYYFYFPYWNYRGLY